MVQERSIVNIFIEFGAPREESPWPVEVESKGSTSLISNCAIEHDPRSVVST